MSSDHGPQATAESRLNHHRDVDHEEDEESSGDEEVKCACGLTTAQHVYSCWNRGIEGGRQGEASPDDKGNQDEDHGEVRGSLEHVVGVGFGFVGRRTPKILRDSLAERTRCSVLSCRQEVPAKVTVP